VSCLTSDRVDRVLSSGETEKLDDNEDAWGGTAEDAKWELGFVEGLDKANVEISALRFAVESVRADAVGACSKDARLLNQLKGSHVECGALKEQLRNMRDQPAGGAR